MVWPFEPSLEDMALFSFPLDEAPFFAALDSIDFTFWLVDFGAVDLSGAIAGDEVKKFIVRIRTLSLNSAILPRDAARAVSLN